MHQSAKITPFEALFGVKMRNKEDFNKIARARKACKYQNGDIVLIQKTQFNPGKKCTTKFLGTYKVMEGMPNDRYRVKKTGEVPNITTTAASYMKRYHVDDESL
uniref:Uncharacterized protein n=1 Tax=Anopheles stephensi TaxID=30069 RepID=A0A182YR60_ANOST